MNFGEVARIRSLSLYPFFSWNVYIFLEQFHFISAWVGYIAIACVLPLSNSLNNNDITIFKYSQQFFAVSSTMKQKQKKKNARKV